MGKPVNVLLNVREPELPTVPLPILYVVPLTIRFTEEITSLEKLDTVALKVTVVSTLESLKAVNTTVGLSSAGIVSVTDTVVVASAGTI